VLAQKAARHRDSPDPRDAASLGERHHGIDQGKLPVPDCVSGFGESRQPHDSRSETAPKHCSATATCCFCRPARASRCACKARLFRRTNRAADGVVQGACGRGRRRAGRLDRRTSRRTREGRKRRGRGTGERGGDIGDRDPLFPAGGRGMHPESAGIDVAVAAAHEHRVRTGRPDHRPTRVRGRARTGKWLEGPGMSCSAWRNWTT